MSEQDRIEEQDEVEAHKHRHGNDPLANTDETEGEKDDFELHGNWAQRPDPQRPDPV
jgi:hypothetical protein